MLVLVLIVVQRVVEHGDPPPRTSDDDALAFVAATHAAGRSVAQYGQRLVLFGRQSVLRALGHLGGAPDVSQYAHECVGVLAHRLHLLLAIKRPVVARSAALAPMHTTQCVAADNLRTTDLE